MVAGGGIWVGVQDTVPPLYPLVLFNSELSGSTLALPDDEFFTVQAVHEKIKASDSLFTHKNVCPACGREYEGQD